MAIRVMHISELDKKGLTEFVWDVWHRMQVHHTLWFMEAEHQLGKTKAFAAMDYAWTRVRENLQQRLGSNVVVRITGGLENQSMQDLMTLSENLAKCWLAQDGVWFQAVEFTEGMNEAKRCNDSVWVRFSTFEAWSVKKFLGLGEQTGLKGLEQALNYRIYGLLNKQSTYWEQDKLVFEMNDCRVQSARKRKNLADYPCKSAGLVEYSRFAAGIDNRIRTECVGCPPDEHPVEWFCSWKFFV